MEKMVNFNYETNFQLENESQYEDWIDALIESEGKEAGEINYIFCNDDYLHNINMQYLQHDTLTDIISFDYCIGDLISGDIRSEEHTSELQSRPHLVCRLWLE